jgi:hypothetical protein
LFSVQGVHGGHGKSFREIHCPSARDR